MSLSTSSSSSASDVEEVELEEMAQHKSQDNLDDADHHAMGDEEMGIVSKYAKVNQPCPFSKNPPKYPIGLEWRNLNYKVVIPLPPKNFLVKLLFKLPIPASITTYLKTKKEVPILNNVSGKVAPGSVVAIMGPTGSGKVHTAPRAPFRSFPPVAFVLLCSDLKCLISPDLAFFATATDDAAERAGEAREAKRHGRYPRERRGGGGSSVQAPHGLRAPGRHLLP
jgi:hypothetical protein